VKKCLNVSKVNTTSGVSRSAEPPALSIFLKKSIAAAAETGKILKISEPPAPPPELYLHRPVWNFFEFLDIFSQKNEHKNVFFLRNQTLH
jgi:hypothetical protein